VNASPRIAVIGAGIAGLSCATALAQAGAAVTLYEKSRGPGGRMSTRRGEDLQCDHGAQYFTASDPAFRAEVSRWEHAGAAAPWTPRLQVLGGAVVRHPDPSVQRFVGTPSMVAPARLLANGLHVVAQTTIAGLQRDGRDWRLSCSERGSLPDRYDAVLLAIPAPQAAALVRSPAPALAVGCEWDAEFGLGLCGDWLTGGKVENAWHSGRQLAHRVARSFG
jgi:renalase